MTEKSKDPPVPKAKKGRRVREYIPELQPGTISLGDGNYWHRAKPGQS